MQSHNKLDVPDLRFDPGTTEPHKSIAIGAAFYNAYIPAGAKCVLLQAVVKDIRFTLDGTTPTAAIGFNLVAGNAPIFVELTGKIQLKFFGSDATSVLQYCFGN